MTTGDSSRYSRGLGLLLLLAFGCAGEDGPTNPAPPAVATIAVTPATPTVNVGNTQQLTATLRDGAGNVLASRPITWTSSDNAVATVDASGLVRGVAPGQVTITATSEGKSGTTVVTVPPSAVAMVNVSPAGPTVNVGNTQQLTATLRDGAGNVLTGRVVSWSSSDTRVATVDASGLVRGAAPGQATITARSEGKAGVAVVYVPGAPGGDLTFASVTVGDGHTCAVTEGGGAYCWGRGDVGQLGAPPMSVCDGFFECSMVPLAVGGGIAFTHLRAGGLHTCGLTSDGSAYCWGYNLSGQLGDGTTSPRNLPVRVAIGLRFASLDAGGQHTCALTSDGTAYCWGDNRFGALGDSTTISRNTPVPVATELRFSSIDAGGHHTCGITSGGVAYCWGYNSDGQLGNGAGRGTVHPAPTPVAGELTFGLLTAGSLHTCGLTGSGAAYCWGSNFAGGLGDGSTRDSSVPIPVSGGLAFVELEAGGPSGHTCGLTSGGAAYCWGWNREGQVGDGFFMDRLQPSAVAGGHAFHSVDAGRATCGRASTGTVYCWGYNSLGQLGNNSIANSAVPVKVIGQP